jgi:hypothetical protein
LSGKLLAARSKNRQAAYMRIAHMPSEIVWKTAAAVVACLLLMVMVQSMNREGFEERFGYDSQRQPCFGMSESEMEACHLKTMIDWFGTMHHNHGW